MYTKTLLPLTSFSICAVTSAGPDTKLGAKSLLWSARAQAELLSCLGPQPARARVWDSRQPAALGTEEAGAAPAGAARATSRSAQRQHLAALVAGRPPWPQSALQTASASTRPPGSAQRSRRGCAGAVDRWRFWLRAVRIVSRRSTRAAYLALTQRAAHRPRSEQAWRPSPVPSCDPRALPAQQVGHAQAGPRRLSRAAGPAACRGAGSSARRGTAWHLSWHPAGGATAVPGCSPARAHVCGLPAAGARRSLHVQAGLADLVPKPGIKRPMSKRDKNTVKRGGPPLPAG